MPDRTDQQNDECTECTLHDRRSFLTAALSGIAMAALLLPDVVSAESMTGIVMHYARRDARGIARYPVPAADGATIDVENEVILVRSGGRCMAFALSCPHQRAMLRVKGGDTAFQCPKHKSEYRIDGAFIRGRATRNMDRHPIRKEGAELAVDPETVLRSDNDAAAWAAAVVTV